jgi:multiple sugar transport system substrate-binding protein
VVKRSNGIIVQILVIVMILFVIGSVGVAAPKKVTLSFWNGFTGPDGVILKDIVKRFNDKNKGKIEIKMDIMGWDVLSQKLPPAIATKAAPGLVLMIGDLIPQYLANGSFQPLDDFWTKTGLKESAYVRNVLDIGKYNGKYYAFPMQFNLIYLYWNKDLFKAAGLDPERPPQTMEELGKYAEKLTNLNKKQYGFGMPVKGATQYWASFFWNNGGEIFDLKAKKSLLNSPQNIKTLEWMQDLAVNKKVTPIDASGADLENLMMSGKLGMYINGPWLINGLKENKINFGITAPPKGSVRQQVISGGIGFAIPSTATKEEKDAAYQFIKYWMSHEISKEWSMKNGFPAWSKAVLNDPVIKADPIQSAISPLNTLGRAYNPEAYNSIGALDNDALWPMIESIVTGISKPADAVKKASNKMDEIFKGK